MEKDSIIDPIQITAQEDANLVEEKHMRKLNQEDNTSMIRESNVIRIPYRHPNHKSRYLKKLGTTNERY